ncbi:uncharacterized protein [Mytilus edulis]|uniref:uncharacterized protein n=1 Tax=Mytilus edulis TaxID=6550 RepID=UPI0039F051BA
MASSFHSCGVCDNRHITKPCIVWCIECNERLCKSCQEHHSLSNASRRHSVIPFTDYQKVPTDVLKISQICSRHSKQLQMYCKKHEHPCCSKCLVNSHKECRDIVDLEDVIKNVKTSNAMLEIEENLSEVADIIHKILRHQQMNLSTIKKERNEIETEIKKTRIKINNHLDKLQEDLIKQVYALEEKENSTIVQLFTLLIKKRKEVAEYKRNIGNIKQHATDLQVFLSLKPIKDDVSSKATFLSSLLQGGNWKQHSLAYKINGTIQSLMSDLKSFGEVCVETEPCNIVMNMTNIKQAQIMVPIVQSRSFENIKLKINKTIETQGKLIYGCCILPDGRFAFTYSHARTVKVFNIQGSKEFEMKIPCGAFDIVNIGDTNTLAVTSGNSEKKRITILDLKRKEIKKTISLSTDNYGIIVRDNHVIYSAYDKGIKMIKLDNESVSDIVLDKIPSEGYLATFRDNIYHTNRLASTVTCYNLRGKVQWTFKNESVLKNPLGIDVDSDGNVYVVGFDSYNLVVISSDGQRHREILTASEGLLQPVTLRRLKKQLLVGNWCNNARLFDFI